MRNLDGRGSMICEARVRSRRTPTDPRTPATGGTNFLTQSEILDTGNSANTMALSRSANVSRRQHS